MNYDDVINLDAVTLEDCEDMYFKKSMITIINDGEIINFEKDSEAK